MCDGHRATMGAGWGRRFGWMLFSAVLALGAAGAGWAADEDEDDDDTEAVERPRRTGTRRRSYNDSPFNQLGRVMPQFEIDQRFFKNPKRDFFNKSSGGKELRDYYRRRGISRYSYSFNRRADDVEDAADYDHDTLHPSALVYLPKAFEEEKGEGWGIFLHIEGYYGYPNGSFVLDRYYQQFIDRKLIFASVNQDSDREDDVLAMAMNLDLLASLRAEFPALDTPESQKRVFVGGCSEAYGGGARVAGVFAVNFPDEIAGLYLVDNAPIINRLPRSRGVNTSSYSMFRRTDAPYLSGKAKRIGRRLRVFGVARGAPGTTQHEFMTYALNQLKEDGFRVRFYEQRENNRNRVSFEGIGGDVLYYGDHDLVAKGLAYLDGDNKIPQPHVTHHKGYAQKFD